MILTILISATNSSSASSSQSSSGTASGDSSGAMGSFVIPSSLVAMGLAFVSGAMAFVL